MPLRRAGKAGWLVCSLDDVLARHSVTRAVDEMKDCLHEMLDMDRLPVVGDSKAVRAESKIQELSLRCSALTGWRALAGCRASVMR